MGDPAPLASLVVPLYRQTLGSPYLATHPVWYFARAQSGSIYQSIRIFVKPRLPFFAALPLYLLIYDAIIIPYLPSASLLMLDYVFLTTRERKYQISLLKYMLD